MAVSPAVRRWYAERIFARMGRGRVPPNFRPLEVPATGTFQVEGCRGGGKNILEVSLLGRDGRVEDVRMGCGLCNPAMYVAADLVAEWARGRAMDDLLALEPLAEGALDAFWETLGDPGRSEDAREKLQYALLALRAAARAHAGLPQEPMPAIPPPATDEG
jgi:hypothetical protein